MLNLTINNSIDPIIFPIFKVQTSAWKLNTKRAGSGIIFIMAY